MQSDVAGVVLADAGSLEESCAQARLAGDDGREEAGVCILPWSSISTPRARLAPARASPGSIDGLVTISELVKGLQHTGTHAHRTPHEDHVSAVIPTEPTS